MGRRLRNLLKKKDLMKLIVYSVSLMESDNYDVVYLLRKIACENKIRTKKYHVKGYKMTLDLLEKSYIGHTVNSLRKTASNASPPNKDVATHARSKYRCH